MERQPPPPSVYPEENCLIEIVYESRQSGEDKVFRGTCTSMTVRDDDTYIVEVHDDASDRIVLADTRSERAVNHKYTSLGQLERLRVYAQVW